jgi:class 3 adenylate cyclase/tetratricopeptide (TPR) repeat protein
MSQSLEHRLVAILHADVVSYSRLMGLDEIGTHRILAGHLDFFAKHIEKFGGTVSNFAGDAVLAYFTTATEAVACAVSVQQHFYESNKDLIDDARLVFRVGINLGDVFFDGHEFRRGPYGNSINVAVRLEGLAPPGGICVADAVRVAVGSRLAVDYEFIGEQAVKNIEEPVRAYLIRLLPEEPDRPPSPARKPASSSPLQPLRPAATPPSEPISISKMPITGGLLMGRDAELAELDMAWQDPETNILTLVAWGGVGKSTLVNHWLWRLAADQYRGADRVYAWSFYHQGTVDRVTAADEFIATALAWFDDPDPNRGSAREKGQRLARLVKQQRTLLILDGIEPLQRPPGPDEGRLADEGLHTLLGELAVGQLGLCIVTTRLPVSDLEMFTRSHRRLEVSGLSPAAGASLLKALEVRGSDEELGQASEEFGGHCLALTLLGNYLNDAYEGDIGQRHRVAALQDDTRQGGHAKRVLSSYAAWIDDPAELELLRVLGLFDRPIHPEALEALRSSPIKDLTEEIGRLDDGEFNRTISRLRRVSLIADRDLASPRTLDAHPLVRQFFRDQLQTEFPQAWREGNTCLFDHFRDSAIQFPDNLQDMEVLFQAVIFGCRAGVERQALHDVYLPRIMRGTRLYAANALGLRGILLSTLSHFFWGGRWDRPVETSPDHEGLTPGDQLLLLQHVRRLLTTTMGFDPPGILQCAQKIKSLSRSLGDTGALYSAMSSDWMRALVTAPLPRTVGLAQEMLSLGEDQGDAKFIAMAYSSLTNSVFFMGRFAEAKAYAEAGLKAARTPNADGTAEDVKTPAVTCRCFEALSLWHLGNQGLAIVRIEQAVADARRLPSAHSLAVALHFDGYISHFCGLPERAAETAKELIALTLLNEFSFWLAGAYVQLGWAMVQLGQNDEGARLLDAGIHGWRATGAKLIVPYWVAMGGEAYIALGRGSEWFDFIEESLKSAEPRGETWWNAELMRLQAIILSDRGERDEAEDLLQRAIDLAIAQGSVSLTLRAAIESVRLFREPTRVQAALDLVRRTYESVPHEFETRDFNAARQLLAQC